MANITSLAKRAGDAFNSTSTEVAQLYLTALCTNLAEIEKRIHKHLIGALVAGLAFVLVQRAAVGEIDIGPLKVKDLSFAQKLLPLVLAFLYNQLALLYSIRMMIRNILDEGIKKLAKPIVDHAFHCLWYPPSWFLAEDIFDGLTGSSVFSNITVPIKIAIVFLPVVFLVYAFYRCFHSFGMGDWLVWVVLIASLLLLAQGLLFFFKRPS